MIDIIKELYFVKLWRTYKYKKKFIHNTNLNLFNGVFSSFQEAQENIPKEIKNKSYDNDDSAQMYENLCHTISSSDYPNIFWLKKLLKEESSLFDLGGHIGVKYYAYSHYFNIPKASQWLVQDLPSITKKGVELAKEKGKTNLNFTNNILDFNNHDILFVSGSLQYIDIDLAKEIDKVEHKPKYVLVTLPLTKKEKFYTINNIGTACCPYILRNKDQFITSFEKLGYTLKDLWDIDGKRCELPLSPSYSIDSYTGLLFEL